jgi:hypothetical protein
MYYSDEVGVGINSEINLLRKIYYLQKRKEVMLKTSPVSFAL